MDIQYTLELNTNRTVYHRAIIYSIMEIFSLHV
nr:MAG TPA: hypothetical protein [Bacteriophage sp.]